jgi:hypothetical protein
MDQIPGDLPFCACFIDDITIWTNGSFKLLLQQLSTVLDRLVAANPTEPIEVHLPDRKD